MLLDMLVIGVITAVTIGPIIYLFVDMFSLLHEQQKNSFRNNLKSYEERNPTSPEKVENTTKKEEQSKLLLKTLKDINKKNKRLDRLDLEVQQLDEQILSNVEIQNIVEKYYQNS